MTLICTVTKPAKVIPPLTVAWFHEGVLRNGVIQSMNGGATVMNTLRFDSSVAGDSGNYTCISGIVIPESTNVSQSASIEVIFRGEFL